MEVKGGVWKISVDGWEEKMRGNVIAERNTTL